MRRSLSAGAMASAGEGGAARLFEVERFEHLSASPERVLLRVDGRYLESPGRRILEATLFVDDGLAVRRHGALPDPSAAEPEIESWLWRAAFAVPANYLTDARMSFALEAQPGVLLALPEPRPVALRAPTQPLSTRAARTARRYAAAIAVMVTVAVAPGAFPASARDEILKVRRPDGSIVYLAADGTPVAQIPPGAEIIDETGAAPPAPAQPAPPAQTTLASPQPAASSQTVQSDGGKRASSASKTAPTHTVVTTDSTRAPHAAPQQPPASGSSSAVATDASQRAPRRHSRRAHRHVAQAPAVAPAPAQTPPRDGAHVTTPEQARHAPALQSSVELAAESTARLKPIVALDPAPVVDPVIAAAAAPPLGSLAPSAAASTLAPLAPSAAQSPTLEPLASPPPADAQTLQPLASPPPPDAHTLQPIETDAPASNGGTAQPRSGSRRPAVRPAPVHHTPPSTAPQLVHPAPAPTSAPRPAPVQPSVPSTPSTSSIPFGALPSPNSSVPSFVISNFQIPPFLLSIYQAAATEYGIQWEVLAAINEIETNYGRDLSISSAGALGWMQFMPDTWKMYGVDANRDGKRDPYNPADAIFAAARYLKAAGGDKDIRQGIFAYNHATWYVDSVMLRAQLIAAYPPELIGALTGLTQGRSPIAAPARYAGEVTPGKPTVAPTDTPSNPAQGIDIYTRPGAPVVAVADGVIKRTGRSRKKGLYVVLQDAYGNEYTYSGLGEIAQRYPVPNVDALVSAAPTGAPPAAGADPAPSAAATSGSQSGSGPAPAAPVAPVATKLRLFAHPARQDNRGAGGADQILATQNAPSGNGFVAYDGYFADALGLNSTNATLRDLRPGATVVASTVLGRVGGAAPGQQAKIQFEVQPAGKGAPEIDPRPVLDGWRLLETTQAYGPSGKKALSKDAGPMTVGESMLLPKPLLEEYVLADKRLKIYAGGREDIKTGQVDRRVLEVLEYLADSGFAPTVSALKSGHTAPGKSDTESELALGDGIDITAINDIPLAGHQQSGGLAEQVVRQLMQLQGTLRPHQIVSLVSLGQNTVSRHDHADRIHIGFEPLYGDNTALGKAAQSALGPAQWGQLASRLGTLTDPSVPVVPSPYALPDH